MDIFFVLSGFLITSILLRSKGTPDPYIPFLARRAVRIMPPYFLTLAVVTCTCGIFSPSQFSQSSSVFWGHAFFHSGMTGNMEFLGRVLGVLRGAAKPPNVFSPHLLPTISPGFGSYSFTGTLAHFWSVSIEEWYYVLWAPIVLIFKRRSIVIFGCFLVLLSLACRWFGFENSQWYFNFVCRLDVLAIGGLLALWHERRATVSEKAQMRGDRCLAAGAGVAIAFLSVLLFCAKPILGREIRESIPFAAFGSLCLAVSTAGILAIILHRSPKTLSHVLAHPSVVYIGRRSYMMYLIHVPVYVALTWALPGKLWMTAIVSLALTIGLAAASWRFFESPLLSWRDHPKVAGPQEYRLGFSAGS